MAAVGNLASAGWVAMNWPQIAAAAEPMGHMHDMTADMTAPPAVLKTLSAAEAAEVDAIANQIVPGGANPGARDAHAVYFIDNALGSFFAAQLPVPLVGSPVGLIFSGTIALVCRGHHHLLPAVHCCLAI